MIEDFALQLKQGTKKSHTAAENTKFVASFLRGVVNVDSYMKLIGNFYFVYRAMEEELEKHRDSDVVGPILYKALYRTASLEKDCEYFYGSNWRNMIAPTEACQQYVNRIREVSPELLIAHHYTRYIGDLSGGQILRGIAEKALDLTDGGLAFYEFPDIEDKKQFKETYRATLNLLPVDQSDVNKIVTEANFAFRLNMYMFDELQGDWFKSMMTILCATVKGKQRTNGLE